LIVSRETLEYAITMVYNCINSTIRGEIWAKP
jgi:hypothetical protein